MASGAPAGTPGADICTSIRSLAAGAIFEHGLVAAPGSPILIMVSGGSDSTALALLAHDFCTSGMLDAADMTVLHVNHGLRGDDSYRDSEFVRRLAGLAGFAYELRYIDIYSRLDEFGGNVESAGRHLRYAVAGEVLDGLCAKAGVPAGEGRIWVAHTQDDRVETFFMRAIVGTGPGGLAAIRYRNGRVVRPLLGATREDLRSYIAARTADLEWRLDAPETAQVPGGLWREDSTNYDTAGFRSFVRHRLVPVARERNASLGSTLARTLDRIADESDLVESLVDDLRAQRLRETPEGPGIVTEGFDEVPLPLRRRLVYSACRDVLPVSERIEQRHIDILVGSGARAGFAMDLPGGARVRNDAGLLVFSPPHRHAGDDGSRDDAADDVALPIPGCVYIGNEARLEVSEVELVPGTDAVEFARANATPTCIYTDRNRVLAACGGGLPRGAGAGEGVGADAGSGSAPALAITRRREGDFVCPLGMDGMHKKLSDVFIDGKVRRSARDRALVVRAGESIVWVPGVVVDERFKAEAGSALLRISCEGTGAGQGVRP